MTTRSRDDDDDLLVAYATGALDEAARVRCEQRLAADPTFAERLLAFEAMDLLAATTRHADAAPATRTTSLANGWRAAAWFAAAALTMALGLWWQSNEPPALGCSARAVASFGEADLAAYATRLGLPAELQYVGAPRNTSTPRPAVTAEQFLAAAAQREAERSRTALTAPATPVTEPFFTVRLAVDRSCHALLLQLDEQGRWLQRFPSTAATPLFGECRNPLAPGVHTLPRPVVLANAIGSVSLHPGFARTDATTPAAWLLVLHADPLPATALTELATQAGTASSPLPANADATSARAWAAARTAEFTTWLQQRGFTCQPVTTAP